MSLRDVMLFEELMARLEPNQTLIVTTDEIAAEIRRLRYGLNIGVDEMRLFAGVMLGDMPDPEGNEAFERVKPGERIMGVLAV